MLPGRLGSRVGRPVGRGCGGQVEQAEEAAQRAVGLANDDETVALSVEPVRRRYPPTRAPRTWPPIRGLRLAIRGTGRLGISLTPSSPVDRRQHAGQIAEHELLVIDGALLGLSARGLEIAVDVGADAPECSLVPFRVAPAQVDVEHIARQRVREQPIGPRLNERQATKPGEQVVGVVEFQRVPQQVLCGHSGERADLQRPALLPVRHDIEELSQQCSDQIRGRRVEGHAAARGHVDKQ